MLNMMNKTVIPIRMKVSFHSKAMPTPLSIIPFKIIMNHLAGIILLNTCRAIGMLLMGKNKTRQ